MRGTPPRSRRRCCPLRFRLLADGDLAGLPAGDVAGFDDHLAVADIVGTLALGSQPDRISVKCC